MFYRPVSPDWVFIVITRSRRDLVQATGLGSNILHLLVSISVCLQLRFVKLSINEYVMLCDLTILIGSSTQHLLY